jgi:hypothetical protein
VTLKCRENPSPRAFSRLATVRQQVVSVLALILGAAAAVALVSCGGGEDAKLLPGHTAAEITENLDRVRQYSEADECVGAEDAVAEVTTQIEALKDIDPKLQEALRRGATRLNEVVASCEEETPETLEPEEETTTEETEELPPGLEKKEEKEREKEEKELEKEEEKAEKEESPPAETTPEEAPTTTTPPPAEGGGTGASGGVGPAAPVTPGGE